MMICKELPVSEKEFMDNQYIQCIITHQAKMYQIDAKSWFEFLVDLNEIMDDSKVSYPLGLDHGKQKYVQKTIKEVKNF